MKDEIKGLVPHILSFVINEICKYGFMIAYEKELADLKGLVEPDSISPDDFELLEAVDHPIVKVMLKSIERVIDCSKTYMMINNVDELEVMENEEYNMLASDSHFIYIIDWESKDYKDLLYTLNPVYLSVSNLLYHTACQIKLDEVDIPEEMYNEFVDKYAYLRMEKVYNEDKNVGLLYDLIIDLNADIIEIGKLTDKEDFS